MNKSIEYRSRSIPTDFVTAPLPVLICLGQTPPRFSQLFVIRAARLRYSIDLFIRGPLVGIVTETDFLRMSRNAFTPRESF